MADNDHKSIPTAQRHNPKGFEDAANNTQLTKDSSGNIAWEVGSSGGLVTTTVNIGDWDMDTTTLVNIAHSLSATEWQTIRSIEVIIRNDTDTQRELLTAFEDVTSAYRAGGVRYFDSTNIRLLRRTGGIFDNTSYDSTSYNRGFITFSYTPD